MSRSNGNGKRKQDRLAHFAWRDGSRVKLDPTIAGLELSRIQEQRGGLEPASIVEEARPEDAPLHPAFEWNDTVAGERYRQWQARDMVRSLRIVYENAEPAPAYVHVRYDDGGQYQSVSMVVQNVDLYGRAMDELKGKLTGLLRGIEDLRRAATEAGQAARASRIEKAARKLEEELRE